MIYNVFVSFLAVAMLITQVKIYRHARQHQMNRVLHWAIPGLVNAVIAVITLAVDDIYAMMNLRETMTGYLLSLALAATSMTFCLVSVQRLWEMAQTMPFTNLAPQNAPPETGVWPPAPAPPQ